MAKTKSFTIIEILIIIVIVGILFAITTSSYQNSKMRARDSVRKIDLQNFKMAMTLYRSSNGQYPISGSVSINCAKDNSGNFSALYVQLQNSLSPYLNPLPHDPVANCNANSASPMSTVNEKYGHEYLLDGNINPSRYAFWAALEDKNDPSHNGTLDPNSGPYVSISSYTWYANYMNSKPAEQNNMKNVILVGCRLISSSTCDEN